VMKPIAVVYLLVAFLATCTLSLAQKPDLVIEQAFTEPPSVALGDLFSVHLWVRNIGDADANESFTIEFSLGEAKRRVVADGPVPADGQKQYVFSGIGPFIRTGEKEVAITIDPEGAVDESNEENNRKLIIVKVLPLASSDTGRGTATPAGDGTTGNAGSGTTLPPKRPLDLLPIIIIIVVIVVPCIAAVLVYVSKSRKKLEYDIKQAKVTLEGNVESELSLLQSEKQELEQAINIAKIKFYKRQMDEESYKGIVKDHQEKLTRIEARISGIEKRVTNLENNQADKNKR